jgi:hypothetical protein
MDVYEGDNGLVYDRKSFTPWVFEVLDVYNENEFVANYRTTFRDGKECERLTLMPLRSEYALVQVDIFKNKDYQFWSSVPCNVYVDWKKKYVAIKLLCDIEVTNDHDVLISPRFE